jgi:RNA polymerase sigma factor (sigma-70 family)
VLESANSRSTFVNRFFQENYDTLRRWALQITSYDRVLSEDIVHDAYLHFHKGLTRTEDVQNIDGYVYAALRNSYRSHIRKHSRQRSHQISIFELEALGAEAPLGDPMGSVRTTDDLREVCEFACSRKAKSIAASILILRFFHGFYPGEISRLLNRSRNAIETRLLKMRRDVIEHLAGETKSATVLSFGLLPNGIRVRTHSDLIAELQKKIFDACEGPCIRPEQLRNVYRKEAKGPERDEISHIVSCEKCLNYISEMLRIPGLQDRHPFDALGSQTTIEAMQIGKARAVGSSY